MAESRGSDHLVRVLVSHSERSGLLPALRHSAMHSALVSHGIASTVERLGIFIVRWCKEILRTLEAQACGFAILP